MKLAIIAGVVLCALQTACETHDSKFQGIIQRYGGSRLLMTTSSENTDVDDPIKVAIGTVPFTKNSHNTIQNPRRPKGCRTTRQNYRQVIRRTGVLKIPGVKLVKLSAQGGFLRKLKGARKHQITVKRPLRNNKWRNRLRPKVGGAAKKRRRRYDLCREERYLTFQLVDVHQNLAFRIETIRCKGFCSLRLFRTWKIKIGICSLRSHSMVVYVKRKLKCGGLVPQNVNVGIACECKTFYPSF